MQFQLEHEHELSHENEPPKSQSIKKSLSKSHSSKKHLPLQIEQPQPIFFIHNISQQTSSFNFYIDGLQDIRKESEGETSEAVIEAIKQRKKFSEERVYEAIVHTTLDFVGIHFKDFNLGVKSELQNMFENIHQSVEAGIWDGRYEISKKNNYFSANKKEAQLVAHITEELVKKNIDNFRDQLNESEAMSEYLTVSVSQRAKSEVEKTKKAEEFVKRIQGEQMKHFEFMSRKKEERQELEVRSMQERQARDEEIKKEKHQLVLKRMARQKEIVNLENQHKKKIQSEYLKFLTNQKKPLHKTMQQEYEKRVMEQQKIKFKKLKELMDERRPITFDEINEHMQRYDQLLYQNEQYRKQKRELKQHQMEVIASKKPYRSKFYSLSVQSSPKDDMKELRTSLIKKQTDFSEHVKKNFLPRSDQKKQQELEDLMRKITHHRKNVYHSRKYMQEGKRNLQKLHLLIGQLRAKNKLKQNLSLQVIAEVKPTKKYKNYLEEVKQSRTGRDPNSIEVDYDRKLNQRDHEFVRMQAMMKEQKAKQQDLYLDSAMQTLDFDSHMKGKKTVEHDFIEAANAKLAILKKYNNIHQSETLEPASIQQ